MWARKSTDQIYSLSKVKTGINKSPTDAAVQAMKAKYLIGAVRYMRDSTIEKFFIKQKQRIGDALDEIDNALPNMPTTGGKTPWAHQGLKKLWDEYMDDAFKKAKSRTDNTMSTMLTALERKWVLTGKKPAGAKGKGAAAQTTLIRQIKALKTEWAKQKRAGGWKQPNW